MDQSEDEFDAFDQFDPSEGPSGDLGDPSLTEADLQGTSLQTDTGFKRKPSTSLQDLLEGQPGKDVPGKSQPKLPPPHSKPQLSRPKPDTRICDHDRHANIKPKPDINKSQLNFYKTFTKAFLFLFILVSLLK